MMQFELCLKAETTTRYTFRTKLIFKPVILENEGVDDPDLYEGDMILTADQRMAAEMGLDVDRTLGRGSVMNRQWPGGVMAYVIDSSLCKYEMCEI